MYEVIIISTVVLNTLVKYDSSFFDTYWDMLDIACLRASQKNIDDFFIGRNKYRKDGHLSKIYTNKQHMLYLNYKQQLLNSELVFLLYMRCIYPLVQCCSMSVPFLTRVVSDYFNKNRNDAFLSSSLDMSVEEMKVLKNEINGGFIGCYLIYNVTKKLSYVGQSTNVYNRLYQHFTNKGCESLYFDYMDGDVFRITVFPLSKSSFTTLDSMERDLINRYDAYTNGYNKTMGNGCSLI